MFGYVRIFKPQMRICEYEQYKAVYCTLCKELGREYGPLSRMLLNYDFTFVALLYMALHKQPPCVERKCCVFNPLKICSYCTAEDREGFKLTCAMTAEMYYHKLSDNVADSGWFASIGWRLLRLTAAPLRRKARKRYPEMDALVAKCMTDQAAAEKAEDSSIDSAAEPSARLISELAQMIAANDTDRRDLKDFGYFFGRWIYLIDAFDDMADDVRKNSFNPFAARFGLTKEDIENNTPLWSEARIYANECLNMTVARALTAFDLLDTGVYAPIFENILQLGLGEAQRKALNEKELHLDEQSV